MCLKYFPYLFGRKLPTGQDLEQVVDELGVSRFGTVVEAEVPWGRQTTTNEAELQRRVLEVLRAHRESYLWLIALVSALASLASAMAAWVAVWKR